MPPINGLRNSLKAHGFYKYFVPTGLLKAPAFVGRRDRFAFSLWSLTITD